MALTPTTLPRHELVGLEVTVVAASNPDVVGLTGRAVAETTRTIGIAVTADASPESATGSAGTHRHDHDHNPADELAVVPKSAATFEWQLPTGETVRTAGERLVARPARRTEHTGDSTWR